MILGDAEVKFFEFERKQISFFFFFGLKRCR